MKKNIILVCHLISRCHSAGDLNSYINEYNRKCRRVGEDDYKFRTQHFSIIDILEHFVITYIEHLIGNDMKYCDKKQFECQ